MDEIQPIETRPVRQRAMRLLSMFVLATILVAGGYFRFVGLDWGENQHLHPDERFMTMVETDIAPVANLGQYFDTNNSSLNPNNRGYSFYVYGDLPLVLVRYLGEWLGKAGYDQIYLVGRQLSAAMDLGTVLWVYLIAMRLYRKRWLGLIAAALAAFSVQPIQLAHYFTVDTFTNFFGMMAFYFVVWALTMPEPILKDAPANHAPADSSSAVDGESTFWAVEQPAAAAALAAEENNADVPAHHLSPRIDDFVDISLEEATQAAAFGPEEPQPAARPLPTFGVFAAWGTLIPYLLFGAALGLAMACKINALFLAILLPGVAIIRFLGRPAEERMRWVGVYVRNLFLAGILCVIVFRVFQPYAFSGPGFFGVIPNPKWTNTLRDLANQSTGDIDFPPALQWARRPIGFAWENMVLWGLGLPFGIAAWAGFLWMGLRILRGQWREHLILWGWTGLYFAYQSYNWTRTMRYQMLVYPTLAIIAAWAVVTLWPRRAQLRRIAWARIAALLIGVIVVGGAAAWAFAFTRIYTRPMTRVEASRWIYQNVPGPINLHIQNNSSEVTHPLAFSSGYNLQAGQPLMMAFHPQQTGDLMNIVFDHLLSVDGDANPKTVQVIVSEDPNGLLVLSNVSIEDPFPAEGDPLGKKFVLPLQIPVHLEPAKTYYLTLVLQGDTQRIAISGAVHLSIYTPAGTVLQALPDMVAALRAGQAYTINYSPVDNGMLREISFDHVVDWANNPQAKTLRVAVVNDADGVEGSAQIQSAFLPQKDPRGKAYTVQFDPPIALRSNRTYTIRLEQVDGPGSLAVYGSRQANESSWDDALPLGLDGYNPYDYNLGAYRSDLNFEMYWDDNVDKLQRFLTTLDQTDYIFISSNRQWGTTVRVPERYPLTTAYYRDLLGCPMDKEITWCYSVAQPGMFQSKLGFSLVAVFQSDPNLGPIRFNTQFAEEAFTVYDAPKVMIFQKTADYDSNQVHALLGAVDLTHVVHLTPRKAGVNPGDLLLPLDRLLRQRAGGTWVDLFHPEALYNRYPGLAAVLWYIVISLLGWMMLPFTRLALHGLPDHGFPFARMVGLLALAYPVWILGSAGVAFSVGTITLVAVALLVVNGFLAYQQRAAIREEWRARWKYYLTIELIFLAFFLLFLFVRLGNPDLWHPWKGGEKPMDFSYFNAVLKSTTFPPYDPWFAGGYINYYYYGFVLIGVPVKWLGIVPSIAYNLILPTLFAMLALGAFSVAFNLFSATRARAPGVPTFGTELLFERKGRWFAGLAAAVGVVLLGNWGTVRMIWHGIQRLAPMNIPFESANLFTHIGWTFSGLVRLFTTPGLSLPYPPGDWYWIPSRAIPGEPITEFPAFTFLYADPHAHMIALPVTVLALAWAVSVVLGRWDWKGWGHITASFLLGSLTIGALWPTNTWDWPTYLALGGVAVTYTALRYGPGQFLHFSDDHLWLKRLGVAAVSVAGLVLLTIVLYQPYRDWYGSAYNQIDFWEGTHTPFWSYMTHWGTFLFVIASWLAWESIDWMKNTPLSSLLRLRRWLGVFEAAVVGLIIAVIVLLIKDVSVAWVALPMLAWAGILLLRRNQSDSKRVVLFLVGTALALTLFVELAVLRGDLGRMNTVFKFYLQAWTLLGISAGLSLIWLLPAVETAWEPRLRAVWQPVMLILILGAALFPVTAGLDKMDDRMSRAAPHTLDGMTYMNYSTFTEGTTVLDLSEDYRAIQWMQRNVSGSPVIVEANTPEYRWGTRFTIYTGLPGVVGWNWHQRQQRAVTPPEWVTGRIDDVTMFYNTTDRQEAEDFLKRYDVRYIVVGQLERAVYPAASLQKFADWNGTLWREVYHDGQTNIYAVVIAVP